MSRRVGNKEYSKWVLVVPQKIVEEAELNEGEDLDIKVEDKEIIIKSKKKN